MDAGKVIGRSRESRFQIIRTEIYSERSCLVVRQNNKSGRICPFIPSRVKLTTPRQTTNVRSEILRKVEEDRILAVRTQETSQFLLSSPHLVHVNISVREALRLQTQPTFT